MKNKSSYALVYINYEGLLLLELGDRGFILGQYILYTLGVQEFKNKYADKLNKIWSKEMSDNPFGKYLNMENFCIQGYKTCYKNGKLGCLCQLFGINKNNKVLCHD